MKGQKILTFWHKIIYENLVSSKFRIYSIEVFFYLFNNAEKLRNEWAVTVYARLIKTLQLFFCLLATGLQERMNEDGEVEEKRGVFWLLVNAKSCAL